MERMNQNYINGYNFCNNNKNDQEYNKRISLPIRGRLPLNMILSETAYKKGYEPKIDKNHNTNINTCDVQENLFESVKYPATANRMRKQPDTMVCDVYENDLNLGNTNSTIMDENASSDLFNSSLSTFSGNQCRTPFDDYCSKFENREMSKRSPNLYTGVQNYYTNNINENHFKSDEDLSYNSNYFKHIKYEQKQSLMSKDYDNSGDLDETHQYTRNVNSNSYNYNAPFENFDMSLYSNKSIENLTNNRITRVQYKYTDTSEYILKETDIEYTLYK